MIPDMIERFGVLTGLSDHTLDNTTAVTSVAMGASIIEKHVTLDRRSGGTDDSFSLEPSDLSALCKASKVAWSALGQIDYGIKSSEHDNIKFRRSLYFTKDMIAGELITDQCVRSVRPGYGLPPKHLNIIIGKRVALNVKKFTPVTTGDIEIDCRD